MNEVTITLDAGDTERMPLTLEERCLDPILARRARRMTDEQHAALLKARPLPADLPLMCTEEVPDGAAIAEAARSADTAVLIARAIEAANRERRARRLAMATPAWRWCLRVAQLFRAGGATLHNAWRDTARYVHITQTGGHVHVDIPAAKPSLQLPSKRGA